MWSLNKCQTMDRIRTKTIAYQMQFHLIRCAYFIIFEFGWNSTPFFCFISSSNSDKIIQKWKETKNITEIFTQTKTQSSLDTRERNLLIISKTHTLWFGIWFLVVIGFDMRLNSRQIAVKWSTNVQRRINKINGRVNHLSSLNVWRYSDFNLLIELILRLF